MAFCTRFMHHHCCCSPPPHSPPPPTPLPTPPPPNSHLTPRAHTMEPRPSAVLKSSRQHVHIVCSTRSEAKGHRRRQVEKSDSIFLHLPSSAPPPLTPHPSPLAPHHTPHPTPPCLSPHHLPNLYPSPILFIALSLSLQPKHSEKKEGRKKSDGSKGYGGMFSGSLGGRISECQNNFEALWPVLWD